MTDGPETPRLRELVYDLNRQVYTLEQARALLTHCREYLSLARAETPRLRALAEQAAKTAHWSIAGPAFGHLEVLPGNPQFDICPHPYCVLVRAGAKEPALKPKEWECICTHHYRAHDRNTGRCNEGGCECSGYVDGPASASLVGVVAGDAPATDAELEGARPDREATCAWDCQLDEGHSGDCSNRQKLPDKTEPEFERLEAQKDAMLAGRRPWESHGAGAAPAQEPEPSWRCFHCGIVLTTEQAARQHFGLTRHDIRACDALTHPAVQQLTFQHWHAIKQWRDTLSDLVDACYTEGTSPTWRLCGVCGMEHHREATLGDQTHVKDCVVDTAERLLRSWSTLAATSAGVALGEAMFKAWLKQRVADDYNPWGVEKHENLLREAFHAGALAAHGAGRPQRTE